MITNSKCLAPALGVLIGLFAAPSLASPESDAVVTTSEHISAGRLGQAIRAAESAADRGHVHPDISFNRGLAYLKRAQGTTAEPGDLGQAAAGFAEALQFAPDDAEARRGLEQAQLLVAQNRSGSDASPESSSLGLFERVILAIPTLLLLVLGGLGSFLSLVGVVLRRSANETRATSGGITALLGVFLLVPSFAFAGAQHLLFEGVRVAVVVSDRAQVVDEAGGRIPGQLPYRQATVLHVGPAERGLVPVINFGQPARVPTSRLRIVAQPSP